MVNKKVKTSITLDKELDEWIDSQVKKKRFASKSHAIEYALTVIKDASEKEKR